MAVFRIPGACRTGDNTISGFILNKKKKNQTKILSVLIIVVASKKIKITERAALTIMLAEGKAVPKLFLVNRYLMT